MKIKEYMVLGTNDDGSLSAQVDSWIKKGWQPYGSLQVVCPVLNNDTPAPGFYQAMVIYED